MPGGATLIVGVAAHGDWNHRTRHRREGGRCEDRAHGYSASECQARPRWVAPIVRPPIVVVVVVVQIVVGEVLPLDEEITSELASRNSSAALIGRTGESSALDAVRESLDFGLVTDVQGEVLRGERVPLY